MQTVVIDFAAARARIERLAEHSIEISCEQIARAMQLPAQLLAEPARHTTMLDQLRATLDEQQIAELLHVTLEECR